MTTIARKFIRNGVATDMTSVVLGASGIVRTDTGATLPGTANLAFTHVATGTYSIDFVEPLPGLTYTGTINWVSPNNVPGSRTFTIAGGSSAGGGGVSGDYTSQSMIETAYGADFPDILSDTTGAGIPNTARYANAISSTEALFNRKFRVWGWTTPIPSASADFGFIQDLATKYALTELYFVPRGSNDNTDKLGGQLAKLRQWVLDQLQELLQDPIDGAVKLNPGGAGAEAYDAIPLHPCGCNRGYGSWVTSNVSAAVAQDGSTVFTQFITYLDGSLDPLDGQLVSG